jgi:cytochrome c oxidase subunit 2
MPTLSTKQRAASPSVWNPARRRWLQWTTTGVAAAAITFARFDARAATPVATPRVIPVHARKFVFTPNRITLAPHESVIFELTAQDSVMGFSIPQFGVRADVPPGVVVRLPVQANAAGTVDFLCDVFCGSGHETMSGTIVVG